MFSHKVFYPLFSEEQPQRNGFCAFFRRKWRAVKRVLTGSNRGSYRFDQPPSLFEPDPSCPRLVAFRKLDDPPGPSTTSLAEMDPAKNKPVIPEQAEAQPSPVPSGPLSLNISLILTVILTVIITLTLII